MTILALLAHIILVLIFMLGVGVSCWVSSIFGVLFFCTGIVMSVSFIVEDDVTAIQRARKGKNNE